MLKQVNEAIPLSLDLFANDIRHFAGMRILITGGTGFIGSWLCASILLANAKLGTKIRYVACDRHLIFQGPFDHIIHLAPSELQLFKEWAQHWGGARILYASSGAVQHKAASYRDGYASAKRENEHIALAYEHAVTARLYTLMAPNLPSHLAAAQFLEMARSGGPIVVHSGGSSIRTYLWAGDLVAWLWAIFARGKPAVAYEVGGSTEYTIAELAARLGQVAGVATHMSGPVLDGDRYVPDLTLARELGCQETIGLDEALRRSL